MRLVTELEAADRFDSQPWGFGRSGAGSAVGLQPTSDALQPNSDSLHPTSDGLHPISNGLQPFRSSFYRAMQRCEGVVLLLDDQATPFLRIWCCNWTNNLGDRRLASFGTVSVADA